jgi:hypothetical protein
MRKAIMAVACLVALGGMARAQQPAFQDSLLDHLAGKWVLQGTIAGKQTTHDVTAEWALAHQYLLIHDISREKKSDGQPQYQAMVFIGWDPQLSQYVCIWLDDYGWGADNAIAHAKRNGDEIPFLFQYAEGPFHTIFAYDKQSDTWQWRMDAEQKGTLKPFARVKLTRK